MRKCTQVEPIRENNYGKGYHMVHDLDDRTRHMSKQVTHPQLFYIANYRCRWPVPLTANLRNWSMSIMGRKLWHHTHTHALYWTHTKRRNWNETNEIFDMGTNSIQFLANSIHTYNQLEIERSPLSVRVDLLVDFKIWGLSILKKSNQFKPNTRSKRTLFRWDNGEWPIDMKGNEHVLVC